MRSFSLVAVLLHLLLPSHLRAVQRTNAAPQCTLPPPTAPDTATTNCTPPVDVNTSLLTKDGEWVKVSWAACIPSASDFVALLPADASITATSPLKLVPTYGAATGSIDFFLYNLRGAVTARLYRGGLVGQPQLLATSQPMTWRYPNEPTGAHLALTATASEMRVTWTTADEATPVVWYAPSADPASVTMATATSSKLERSDMYGDAVVNWQPSRPLELSSNATRLGFIDLGTQHSAVMSGLVPGVTYTYTLGSGGADQGGVANVISFSGSFIQPPGRGDAGPVTFLVAADMGAADVDGANWDDSGCVASRTELSMRGWDNRPAANTTAQMLNVTAGSYPGLARPQAVFVNGDLSYARGFGAIWQAFLNQMAPLASTVPLMTCPGNHESNWPHVGTAWNTSSLDSGGEGGVAYSHLFPMPPPSTTAAPWYSFDIGRVHIVVLSTEADVGAGSQQVEWLSSDLSAAEEAHWKIVMAHRFFYIDSSTPDADAAAGAVLRAELESVMVKYGVALTFTGHHHSYQRTKPLVNGAVAAGGIVHVVAGHAGAGLSGLSAGRPDIKELFATPPGLAQEHGFLHVTFNATHAVITAIRSSDGAVVDQFAVEKKG